MQLGEWFDGQGTDAHEPEFGCWGYVRNCFSQTTVVGASAPVMYIGASAVRREHTIFCSLWFASVATKPEGLWLTSDH